MNSLNQLVISNCKRQWILMDTETCLPLLYPLRDHIDHLAHRSLSTQSASLQAVKFFYEFWLQKHRITFCYSFHSSDHNPYIAIEEMAAFSLYLENGRVAQSNLLPITPGSTSHGYTNAARFRAVIQFVSFLINTYISPAYRDDSPKALSLLASRLHTRLHLCRDSYRTLTQRKPSQRSHCQGFQSMTNAMVASLYGIIAPSSTQKHNPLNPFPSGHIQFRNFLIVRLLLNYGLRIGELLLLECSSIKSNIKGDKFSLIVTTVEEGQDPRKNVPSLKNVWANRVLELDKQDYSFLSIYIERIRPKTDNHDFIFTSSQGVGKPLSYTTIHSIFSKIDDVFTNNYPEYKSQLYSDALQRLTPHVTRHTWAYLTLQRIYHIKYLNGKSTKNRLAFELSVTGLIEEAKDELRLMGGWSPKSQMPDFYAKRFLSEQANTANIQRIAQDNMKLNQMLNTMMGEYNNEPK
ncbi:putative integrase/recombinase [Yersinia intermedia]|uniref:site-specific integrase n=1 Tax=Yersinia intermedia TaxID=631 RepID=UPI0005E08235|nr:putative integrase/recombinase [Yersinia intermedia]CNG02193.1 putative integrase/recombinase [Yersinia intermedia]